MKGDLCEDEGVSTTPLTPHPFSWPLFSQIDSEAWYKYGL
jgi:hypothetical protein